MDLVEAIAASGMTPPRRIVEGRWLRFPGIGKSASNRAGWCRVISPTLAIFGDWSSGFTETWRDNTHIDDARSARLLREAREREQRFANDQRARQETAAVQAQDLVRDAIIGSHPYLIRKGFPRLAALVRHGKLVIPVRDVARYQNIISAQLIDEAGDKKFLTGGRTRGGIYRLGIEPSPANRVVLCEGYATGLSLDLAMSKISRKHSVIVCFSAKNLELVAQSFGYAVVCADNDASKTGEEAAKRTGLKWIMPADVGTDYNDMHQQQGIHAVLDALRTVFMSTA